MVNVSQDSKTLHFYKEKLSSARAFGLRELAIGFAVSLLIMVGSTWGLLYVLSFFGVIEITLSKLAPYTSWMLAGSLFAAIVGVIVNLVMLRWPATLTPLLSAHRHLKKRTGEYFLSPEAKAQDWRLLVRRSLYGSVLVAGIALTLVSFDLMVYVESSQILQFGAWVLIACTAILPLTVTLFYYGPWILKDAGLFHLDREDRSISNVGDDIEDMLEFVAGIDIVLVWIELTANTYIDAPWLSIFVILVALGPLFSIMVNFSLVFLYFKSSITVKMIELLLESYETPDIYSASDIIKKKMISLIATEILDLQEEITLATDGEHEK